MRRLLTRITLVCADTIHPAESVIAMKKCLDLCVFHEAILFTHSNIPIDGIRTIVIPVLNSKEEYSQWIVKELYKHFHTDFCLIVQHDSWILDPSVWTDEFYDYDMIGAPWLESDGMNVGNGGFSLKSKKLQTILGTDPMINVCHPEDSITARLYRPYLEQTHGIRFPSAELADRFAFELREPNQKTFGFHGHFHEPFKPSVLIQRQGALGDVLATEPLLRHFHSKGFHVYLDTAPHFEDLFDDHDFPVRKAREKDGRISVWYIDLGTSYETKPDQLHLKSYFEFAGIWNYKISKPTLTKPDRSYGKLFDRYVVLHIDNRPQPFRNVMGVNWGLVVDGLRERGYEVFQVGESEDFIETGAIRMRTPTLAFLKYVIGMADLFIGIDSGPSHLAVAMDIPAIIFFGSVLPELIHPDLSKVSVIRKEGACDTPGCWHSEIGGTTGKECVVDKEKPPCSVFKGLEKRILKEVDRWIGKK